MRKADASAGWVLSLPVPYHTACAAVHDALEAHATAAKGVVVTELLGGIDASAVTSRSIAASPPGRCFRCMGRRPCMIISLVWLAAIGAAAGLAALGELDLTLQYDLFQDLSHPDVMRNDLADQLYYASSAHNRLVAGRGLDATTGPGATSEAPSNASALVGAPRRRLAGCPVRWEDRTSDASGFFAFEFVYAARDNQPLLEPAKVSGSAAPSG